MNDIIITCPAFIWKIIQRIKYGKPEPIKPNYPKDTEFHGKPEWVERPKYMFGSPAHTEELLRALHESIDTPSRIYLNHDFFLALTSELREYRLGVKKDLDMNINRFCGIPIEVRNIEEAYSFEF